jgi:glycosyltransferase involved in cell wall biosynthesis
MRRDQTSWPERLPLIAVDAHRLVCEEHTSGATYIGGLLRYWHLHHFPAEFALLVPFVPSSKQAMFSEAGGRWRFVTPKVAIDPSRSFSRQVFWNQVIIPRLVSSLEPDVFFAPFHMTPRLPERLRVVTTIHDLCFLDEPRWSVGYIVHMLQVLSAVKRADRLISVSQFTRAMLQSWAPGASARTALVHNAIPWSETPRPEGGGDYESHFVGDPYFLWVGNPSPRKNLDALFGAFRLFLDHKVNSREYKLTVVAPSAAHAGFRRRAHDMQILPHLVLHGSVTENKLRTLYRQATALVFPSTSEGFGYPILESLYEGCPAICLTHGPGPEILGPLLPTCSNTIEELAVLMDKYALMPEGQRLSLAAKLRARASEFSISATAEKTFRVLTAAVQEDTGQSTS